MSDKMAQMFSDNVGNRLTQELATGMAASAMDLVNQAVQTTANYLEQEVRNRDQRIRELEEHNARLQNLLQQAPSERRGDTIDVEPGDSAIHH